MEQFANNASTTLSGDYTAGDGHIHVASTAAPFKQTGTYTLGVFDQSTKALKVLLRVSAVASGTEFTVTAEGTDANAASGDIVRAVLSEETFKNIGLVLVAESIANNSAGSLELTSWLSSKYSMYVAHFTDVLPANNNVSFYVELSTDNGVNYDTSSNYVRMEYWATSNGQGDKYVTESGSQIISVDGLSNAAPYGNVIKLELFNPGSTSLYKTINYSRSNYYLGTPCWSKAEGSCIYKSTSVVNAVRFRVSSGNIFSGTARIYGMAK